MSFATMEGEIVEVNVRLNPRCESNFPWHDFYPGNYFKTGLLFVGLTWLVVGNSKDFVPS